MEPELYREMHQLEKSHWWFRGRRRIVLSLINRYLDTTGEQRSYIDLGCGTGAMLAELERSGRVVGVDVSEEALRYASGQSVGHLIKATIPEGLADLGESFDCVLMLDLLEHLEDDRGAVRAASALLKPKGILIITVPAYQWLYAPRDVFHQHRRRYSGAALRRTMDAGDLEILLLSHYNMFLFPAAAAARLISRMRREEPGPDLVMPSPLVNGLLEHLFAFERFLIPHMSLPFGLSLIAVAQRREESPRRSFTRAHGAGSDK
jgi:SAM-dependent methyltransferase